MPSWPNLRAAFRWAADHDDLDTAAAIAVYATFLGTWVEQYEPVGWAEELIEPAKGADHRRLAQLYVMAAMCFAVGRTEDAVGYGDAARLAIDSGRYDEVPFEFGASLNGAYLTTGQPGRAVDMCRNMIARGVGPQVWSRSCLVFALTIAGAQDEAVEASEVLLTTSDDNPLLKSMALMAYGFAHSVTDPITAYDVHRAGLAIAQDSGNREVITNHAVNLSRLASLHGEPSDAFDYLTMAIRDFYDSGNFYLMRNPLAIIVIFFDRLGRYEPAATISGFAADPFTLTANPDIATAIAHLREVLGVEAYESLARSGETMTNAGMALYALDQIERARAAVPT